MRARPLVLGIALFAGCATTAATGPRAERPHPVWPAAPAAPVVRWVSSFPDPDAPPAARSGFRRFLDALAGLEPANKDEPVLARPFGLALDGDALLVADPDGPRVLRVDWRKSRAERLGCKEHEWRMPMSIAVGPDHAIYVADAGAGAIVRIEAGHCRLIGSAGDGGGGLERPTGLAFIGDRLYAVDAPRHVIVGYTLDGKEVARFGARGAEGAGLNFPTALAPATGPSLLVVDALNFRVARFSPGGAFGGSFGEAGDHGGAFGRPKAIAVDPRGDLWVSDAQHDVVLAFDAAGKFRFAVGGTGPAGADEGRLALPAGVVASADHLFVADSYNHRVQIYELLGGAP